MDTDTEGQEGEEERGEDKANMKEEEEEDIYTER